MDSIYIALIFPIIAISTLFEFLLSKRAKIDSFQFDDSITSTNCFISYVSIKIMLGSFIYIPYLFISSEFSLIQFNHNSLVVWIFCLVLVDFAYYLFHVVAHFESFWFFHETHHQARKVNLGTGTRMAVLTPFLKFLFYLPLAFIGLPAFMVFTCEMLLQAYQCLIHTELIRKLPKPIEFIFCTPSNHRVHHGINDPYFNKNYGGILIIWDRIFGTYVEETAPVIYGVKSPLTTSNVFRLNFSVLNKWFKEERTKSLIIPAREKRKAGVLTLTAFIFSSFFVFKFDNLDKVSKLFFLASIFTLVITSGMILDNSFRKRNPTN